MSSSNKPEVTLTFLEDVKKQVYALAAQIRAFEKEEARRADPVMTEEEQCLVAQTILILKDLEQQDAEGGLDDSLVSAVEWPATGATDARRQFEGHLNMLDVH